MVKSKRTTDSTALSPFRASVVKIVSASINYNANGRSTYVRTLETPDGKHHTFTMALDGEYVLRHIENLDKDLRNISASE